MNEEHLLNKMLLLNAVVSSQLLLDVLRFEWSPNLMPIIVAFEK